MLSRSAAFDRAFINGAKPVIRCDIIRDFAIRKSNVKIEEGEINVDIEASRRRTFRGVITDEDGSLRPSRPAKATDLVLPYGNELAIYMGFEGTELLPVGVFRIAETVRIGESYEVDCDDRSQYVADARFEKPYAIRTGWPLIEALPIIIGDRYPGLQFEVQSSSTARTETRPDIYFYDDDGNIIDGPFGDPTPIVVYDIGEDPWAQASRLASRFGLEVFINPSGVCIIRDAPRAAGGTAVWTYRPDADSVLIEDAERWTSRDKTNIAYAISEGSGVDQPLKATASITDPAHVLYPTRAFGRRPAFARGIYKDQARTQEVANATVQAGGANIEVLGFVALAHPAHEAGDVVRIEVPNIGLNHLCLVSSWNLDITRKTPAAFATVTTRPAELEEPPEGSVS